MAEVNVLLTCAGQRVDIVRAFRAALADGPHRGRVYVNDADPLSPALFAADVVGDLPRVDDPGYGAGVAEACATHGIRAVLPLTDLDPVVLATAAPEIRAAGAAVFLPTPDVAAGCQDKWGCHEMLLAAGLPSPPTWLPAQVDLDALPYPVMTKARIGFAGRGIHRCADPDELRFFLRYSPLESVVQACLDHATEFSIDCLADLSGRPIGAVPRAMLHSKGGEQIKGETLDDPQLVALAADVVRGLGLVGPCTIQCFRADDRVLGVTDINTRFGGAFPLPQAAGAGYPAKIIAMAAGETVVAALGEHRAGVAMTRFLDQTMLVRGPGGFVAIGDDS